MAAGRASLFGGRGLWWVVGMLAALVLAGLSYAWSASRVIQMGYRISDLQAQIKDGYDLNRKLRVELAHLRRPERIEARAVSQLGLVKPRPEQVVAAR